MSLTSYRTAPPRVTTFAPGTRHVACRPRFTLCMGHHACPGDIGLDAKGSPERQINAPSSERSLQTGCADPTKSAADRQHQRCRTEAAGPAAPPLYQLSAGCEPSVRIRWKSCVSCPTRWACWPSAGSLQIESPGLECKVGLKRESCPYLLSLRARFTF